MEPTVHKHGGVRKGAGRPRKKPKDLQKTRSLRATDKDWNLIQIAARIIKSSHTDKKSRVLVLSDDEFQRVNNFLLEELIENHYNQKWGEEITPQEAIHSPAENTTTLLEQPRTLDEEEAVSVFLEYFRLNPVAASASIQSKLEYEKRNHELRQMREEHDKVMAKLNEQSEGAINFADSVNARVEQLLRFPGYRR